MPVKRKRKTKETRRETMGFTADQSLRARILAFQKSQPLLEHTSATCRYLIVKGLEAIEKEAARG